MKDELSIFGAIGAIALAMALTKLAMALIKLVRSAAEMWADRKVRRFLRACARRVRRLPALVSPRHGRVGPGSPLADRVWHWAEAALLCVYVGYFLVLAAVIATVVAYALPHTTELSPFAEPAAALFICFLLAMANYFYKEALIIRSEVTGRPALVK